MSLSELEAAVTAARSVRDAAYARESVLFDAVNALARLNDAARQIEITDSDREAIAGAAKATDTYYTRILGTLLALGKEIRGPLTDAVTAAEAALNDAPDDVKVAS